MNRARVARKAALAALGAVAGLATLAVAAVEATVALSRCRDDPRPTGADLDGLDGPLCWMVVCTEPDCDIAFEIDDPRHARIALAVHQLGHAPGLPALPDLPELPAPPRRTGQQP